MLRTIEEQSLNAWPALQTMHYDGWVLRFAAGYTRRANSINPLYPSSVDLPGKVSYCQGIYRSLGLATVFKLTAAAQPGDLDTFLSGQGYTREAETSVQALELNGLTPPQRTGFALQTAPEDGWLDAYCDLNRVDRRHLPAMRAIMHGYVSPVCFGTLRLGQDVAALGLAVLQGDCVWLFDIVTAAPFRRQGLGRDLVLHLLAWGKDQGATRSYLQVMLNNAPAQRLYAGLGYREVYRYWYRVRQSP